jgi:hypothetical protein
VRVLPHPKCTVYVVGTLHTSLLSAELIRDVVATTRPHVAVLELCFERLPGSVKDGAEAFARRHDFLDEAARAQRRPGDFAAAESLTPGEGLTDAGDTADGEYGQPEGIDMFFFMRAALQQREPHTCRFVRGDMSAQLVVDRTCLAFSAADYASVPSQLAMLWTRCRAARKRAVAAMKQGGLSRSQQLAVQKRVAAGDAATLIGDAVVADDDAPSLVNDAVFASLLRDIDTGKQVDIGGMNGVVADDEIDDDNVVLGYTLDASFVAFQKRLETTVETSPFLSREESVRTTERDVVLATAIADAADAAVADVNAASGGGGDAAPAVVVACVGQGHLSGITALWRRHVARGGNDAYTEGGVTVQTAVSGGGGGGGGRLSLRTKDRDALKARADMLTKSRIRRVWPWHRATHALCQMAIHNLINYTLFYECLSRYVHLQLRRLRRRRVAAARANAAAIEAWDTEEGDTDTDDDATPRATTS